MIYISHRGNILGKNTDLENEPNYIRAAVNLGLNVEIDVWYINEKFYLGHDLPVFNIDANFLYNDKFWCHAKNPDALVKLLELNIHCFWHENDTVTLTSRGYIWAYPGKQPIKNSIAVLPEINNDNISISSGICSDYILNYKI